MEFKRTFTLVETLVSVAILALVGAALFSTIVYSIRSYHQMQNKAIAIEEIKNQVARMDEMAYNSVVSGTFDVHTSSGVVLSDFAGAITQVRELMSGMGKEMDVTVRYTGGGLGIGQSCGTNCSEITVRVIKLR